LDAVMTIVIEIVLIRVPMKRIPENSFCPMPFEEWPMNCNEKRQHTFRSPLFDSRLVRIKGRRQRHSIIKA
jgi:hypothetical protein